MSGHDEGSTTRADLEDRRISDETEKWIAEMELFRATARLSDGCEPWKAFAAGGATVIAAMVATLGALRAFGLI